MIVVDASAVCAVLLDEPEKPAMVRALRDSAFSLISPVNLWEAGVSIQKWRVDNGEAVMRNFLADAGVSVAQIGGVEAGLAFEAWRTFGKGRHPAQLNLGDCFAYALAKSRDLPLLFKGGDFAMTDIRSAL